MKLMDRWIRDITSIAGLPILSLFFIGLLLWNKTEIALEFLISLIVAELSIYLIRYFYFRQRPFGKKDGFKSLYERLDESSFPSVHSARAAIIALVLSQPLPWIPKIFLWIAATGICASRIYLKRHHPSDVLVGGILGLMISYIVVLLV